MASKASSSKASSKSAPVTPDSTPAPVEAVVEEKNNNRLKVAVAIGVVAIVLGLIPAVYSLVKAPVAKTDVKKDIPVITIASEKGWDKFYPDVDGSASFNDTNRNIFEGLVRYDNQTKII